jgi:serine/threonine-protein kinase SRPK3
MVLISKVWDLFEGKHVFNERLPSREASEPAHLARMIALLGPPPKDLLERGQFSSTFFDEEGAWLTEIQGHSAWY